MSEFDVTNSEASNDAPPVAVAPKKRGRPKGSKNRPKTPVYNAEGALLGEASLDAIFPRVDAVDPVAAA